MLGTRAAAARAICGFAAGGASDRASNGSEGKIGTSSKTGLLGSLAIVGSALGAIAVIGYFSYRSWTGMGEVEMSAHGWIALGLGTVVTLAVGFGLMALVFHSSRNNFDDPADRP